MTRFGRLSVCYVDPGRDFCPGSSRTRQALTLARALARDVDVSVVFRRLGADPKDSGCSVSALEPGLGASDRVAIPRRSLGRFLERRAADFDIVLDAGWPMPGKLTAWCTQRGIPAIPLLDGLPDTSWLGYLESGMPWLGFVSSGRYLRQAPVAITSSPALREAVTRRWRVDPARIVVIGPAIDRALFSPRNQVEARRRLGIDPNHRVIVAGDGLSRGSDLTPLLDAVARTGDPTLRLHVLGQGERLRALRQLAGPGPAVRFHGAVSDELLAQYIAAADLCVQLDQPADPCFTLLECFSSARPVAVGVTPGRRVRPSPQLVSGFAVEHDILSWIRFLQRDCPSRNTLRMMGLAASSAPIEQADRIAASYLAVIQRSLAAEGRETALA
ncbi:MAG TPA: glycosyltransferase family 4 protein [Gemmatimonadales bacterium]|nr:glycosyltransferase family 4 protein [Gemmatimonadales bacterium]